LVRCGVWSLPLDVIGHHINSIISFVSLDHYSYTFYFDHFLVGFAEFESMRILEDEQGVGFKSSMVVNGSELSNLKTEERCDSQKAFALAVSESDQGEGGQTGLQQRGKSRLFIIRI
jgi:hypothetical protein